MIPLKTAPLLAIFTLALSFSGCESSPFGFTPAQSNTLRAEPIAPLTVDYKAIVMATLHDTLKDSMSAVQLRWAQLRTAVSK